MITAAAAIAPTAPGQPAKGASPTGGDLFALSMLAVSPDAEGAAPPALIDPARQTLAAPGMPLPTPDAVEVDPALAWLPAVNIAVPVPMEVPPALAKLAAEAAPAAVPRSFKPGAQSALRDRASASALAATLPAATTPVAPVAGDVAIAVATVVPVPSPKAGNAAVTPTGSASETPVAAIPADKPVSSLRTAPTMVTPVAPPVVEVLASPVQLELTSAAAAAAPAPVIIAETVVATKTVARPVHDPQLAAYQPAQPAAPSDVLPEQADAAEGDALTAEVATETPAAPLPDAMMASTLTVVPQSAAVIVTDSSASPEPQRVAVADGAPSRDRPVRTVPQPAQPIAAQPMVVPSAPTDAVPIDQQMVATGDAARKGSQPVPTGTTPPMAGTEPSPTVITRNAPNGAAAPLRSPGERAMPASARQQSAVDLPPVTAAPQRDAGPAAAAPGLGGVAVPAASPASPSIETNAAPRSLKAHEAPMDAPAPSTIPVDQRPPAATAQPAVVPNAGSTPVAEILETLVAPSAKRGPAARFAPQPGPSATSVAGMAPPTPAAQQATPVASMPQPIDIAAMSNDNTATVPLAREAAPRADAPAPTFVTAPVIAASAPVQVGTPAVLTPPPAAVAGAPALTTTAPAPAAAPPVAAVATPVSSNVAAPQPRAFVREVTGTTRQTVALRPQATALPQPAAGTTAPASLVFGAAIHAASGSEERLRAEPVDPTITAVAAPAAITTPETIADVAQPTLDMRQGDWPNTMIDHIEALRDAANANDTRIRLIPDALGVIDVAVKTVGDAIDVHFAAEDATTRARLDEARPSLALIAEERGLKIGQTIVEAAPANAANNNSAQGNQSQSQTGQQSGSPAGNTQQQNAGQAQNGAQAGAQNGQQQPRQQPSQTNARPPAAARTSSNDPDAAANGRIA